MKRSLRKWHEQGWWPIVHPYFPGPTFKQTVALLCPTCKRCFCLANHAIAEDGAVSPSVVCPYQCGYHTFIVIEGWVSNELDDFVCEVNRRVPIAGNS